eukprot:TRINITY_DN3320_c0_g1_i3.p1 TRINITY_DN3320_c0_g1~~TRINITY_DN3320_c0_g1_i3.p1  ORF type:complete len:549 (-),score=101.27 TRINITY_DN3320_c0_g1_i3:758-2404(-)
MAGMRDPSRPLLLCLMLMLSCAAAGGVGASYLLSKPVGTVAVLVPGLPLEEQLQQVATRFFGEGASLELPPLHSPKTSLRLDSAVSPALPSPLKEDALESTGDAVAVEREDVGSWDGSGSSATLSGMACAFKVIDSRMPVSNRLALCLGWLSLTLIESTHSEYGVLLVEAFKPWSALDCVGLVGGVLGVLCGCWLLWRWTGSKRATKTNSATTQVDALLEPLPATQNKPAIEDEVENEVEFYDKLGSGSSGASEVWTGRFENQLVAIKLVQAQGRQRAQHEIKMLLRAGAHQNVVRLVAHRQVGDCSQIVMSTLSSRSLEEVVECGSQPLKLSTVQAVSPECTHMLSQLTAGVFHLHANNLAHTRLSPSTVRVVGEHCVQICSLGSAVSLRHDPGPLTPDLGTGQCWAPAPELLGDAPMRPGVAADVFALGCLHFYLVTGGAHLYGKRSVRVNRIMAGKPGLPGLLAKVSTHADFVDKAVSHDPSNRATAGGLQEHPALWTSSKAADFVCDLSDQLDSTEACELHLEIDKVGKAVCGKVNQALSIRTV